jgi:hypothetical protein
MILKFEINKILINFTEYIKFLFAEFLSALNYLNAFLIGLSVNMFTGLGFPGKPAPYIIPILVQAFSKSAIKFKNRRMERLSRLPTEREDPVFIMNEKGDIILSAGLTMEKFVNDNILNISQIIGNDGFEYLTNSFYDDMKGNKTVRQIEIFSKFYDRWYEIKIKSIISAKSQFIKEFLIWFTDITELKKHQKKMSDMLAFSNDIISSLPIILEKYVVDDIFAKIADPVLSQWYDSIYIAEIQDNTLKGWAFKHEKDELKKSDIIEISFDKENLWHNTDNSFVTCDSVSKYNSKEEFEETYPNSEYLRFFLHDPVDNYIRYNSDEIFIIAFNKKENIEYNKLILDIICKHVKVYWNLQMYISSYFINYLKSLNEEF